MACNGVSSVAGLQVVPTGWVHLAGTHVVRRDLERILRRRGASPQTEFNDTTDLVIPGSYRLHQLQNDKVGRTDALSQIYLSRQSRRRHVHLVSQDDLADLLAGERVKCRAIPSRWVEMKKIGRRMTVRVRPYRDDG
jgi:hypothetical protein